MPDLEGRTAIVTGAGGGIGRAIALKLAESGCNIGLLDRDAAGIDETAGLVRRHGREAFTVVAHVDRRTEVDDAIAMLLRRLGRVDILVNNAGVLRTSRFVDITETEWRQVLSINLDGTFHVCQAVLPMMLAQASGAIVNMSSWTGKKGVPNHAAYSASKFAVIGLTQSIAGEVAEHGIRVNAVCPGIIVGNQMREQAEAMNREQGLPDVEARAKNVPMRRVGQPEEVADVVAFLASDEARYMTGQAINITGGLWMN